MLKRHILAIVVLLTVALTAMTWAQEAEIDLTPGIEPQALTDVATSMVKGRLWFPLTEQWSAGPVGVYYAEDSGPDWGVGAAARYTVNPDGVLPLRDLLPGLGGLLELPETIKATSYLILPEIQVIPLEDSGVDIVGTIGVGVQAGAFCLEYDYHIVEGGDADNPLLTSGPEVWFGVRWEF